MVTGLRLSAEGTPEPALVVVECDEAMSDSQIERLGNAATDSLQPMIGVARNALGPRFARIGTALTTTLVPLDTETARWQAGVADVDAELTTISNTAAASPRAASTLDGVLRLTATTSVRAGLTAESLAYSMLLAGPEFANWLAAHARRTAAPPATRSILLQRDGDTLAITLDRPDRRNALGRAMRDELNEAFDLVAADPTIRSVTLTGNGVSFCSGGDLDEFGQSTDSSLAHLIRLDRSIAARIDKVRDRVRVVLHGACVGAGIELASYAAHAVARPNTRIVLPELAMGLIPGAGGTVGITRRIGRWRTAYLALTGLPLSLDAALRWGLIDEIAG